MTKQTLKQQLLAKGINQAFIKEQFGDLRTKKAKELALDWLDNQNEAATVWGKIREVKKKSEELIKNSRFKNWSLCALHCY